MAHKVVYEIDKATLDAMRQKLDDALELMASFRSYTQEQKEPDPWIPVEEFEARCRVSDRVRRQMQNGTHPSGFELRTFKKEGTKQVFTLESEVLRYMEGFGTYEYSVDKWNGDTMRELKHAN